MTKISNQPETEPLEKKSANPISLTGVLDADRESLAAQDQLDANRANIARAAVVVFRSFGGGWESPP